MNAERLHVIANAVLEDLTKSSIIELLQQLVSALQNQVNQPQQPQHQQQVASTLQSVYDALSQSSIDDFSPAWKQVLDEIGVNAYLGNQLKINIKNAFERNQITPSVALQEITDIHQNATRVRDALVQMTSSFAELGIGAEELEAGQCELGVVVPRTYVDNNLKDFGKELERFNSILEVFAELATGSRPGFKVRSISSSDLSVFLDMAPEIGACVAIAVERIVELYKKLLEIRKLRHEMKQNGVPEKELKGVERHANKQMDDGIDELVDDLLERYYSKKDHGRKNELKTALKKACHNIAARVDRGFNIEIRVEPFDHDDEQENDEDQTPEAETHIQTILDASKHLQFMKLEGEPLLALPEEESNKEEEK